MKSVNILVKITGWTVVQALC